MTKRSALFAWAMLIASILGLFSGAVAQDAGEPVATAVDKAATAPAPMRVDAAAEARELRRQAFEAAYSGDFRKGLDVLRKAAETSDETRPSTTRAIELLAAKLDEWKTDARQREQEYERAVQRVRHSLLADDYLTAHDDPELQTKLRDLVAEVSKAVNRTPKAEELDDADAEAAAELKTRAMETLADAADPLDKAAALLEGDGDYVRTFREATEALEQAINRRRAVWEDAEVETFEHRSAAVRKLRSAEESVADASDDLEVLIAERPWSVGLAQARLAKDIAPEDVAVAAQEWYERVVARGAEMGRESVKAAEWHDALRAYIGLEELDPDNETFAEALKTTRRHVRVLRLYGPPEDWQPANGAEDDDGDEDAPKPAERDDWRDFVAGVDADMVKAAISQMDELYVTAVDYREATRGALDSLRVLVETPQAGDSFPTLSDDGLRKQFIESITDTLDGMERRDRVDHLDLQLALNSVLRASQRSVKLPVEVICVEFMDGLLNEMDKFSSMIWPYDVADFEKQTMGHFYGVGIQITKEEGEPLEVVTPLADSPGFRAGIKTGDQILAVDGRRTEHLSIDKLVRMITGEKGTKVVLTIKRPGLIEPIEVPIIRDEIHIRTVKGWRRKPDGEWDFLVDPANGIGYIRVTQFTDTTTPDVARVLEDLREDGVRSVVLDLRFNPGGLLRSAVGVSDEFVRLGRIVSTRGRRTRAEEDATSGGEFLDGDVVVLINQYSASAAEIVSGALKDWKRALLVGERTYGKGSVQNVIPLRRRRALLRLTTAYYYLPSGRLIHRRNGDETWGVDPDVKVTVTPKQMRRWLAIRRDTDLLREVDPERLAADLEAQLDADVQLSRALVLLRLMQIQDELNGDTSGAAEPAQALVK